MKNKLKVLLCVISVVVFCFCSTTVAYAKTGAPATFEKAINIIYSYYDYDLLSTGTCIFAKDRNTGDGVLLWINTDSNSLLSGDPYLPNSLGFTGSQYYNSHHAQNWFKYKLFTFDSLNCYSKPVLKSAEYVSIKYPVPVSNASDFDIIYSTSNIYNVDTSELVFQKGTTASPTPTPGTQPSVSASNILSDTFNNNSVKLNGVLQEIVTLLPILLPVLVSLIAIRKGIKFCLATLRTS